MKRIILYSTPTCVYCKMTRELLNKNNVPYTDIDVLRDKRARGAMVKLSHQSGVPVVDIDGEIYVGFNRSELSRALGIGDRV